MTPWLLTEIATGLQKLHQLSLDRTPSADTIAGTAQAWCEAIELDHALERDLDAPRIRRAFTKLAAEVERWPSPKQFLTTLASTPRDQLAIAHASTPADPERAKAAMDEIAAILSGKDAAAEQGVVS